MNWIDIIEEQPRGGQRVLVWNRRLGMPTIQVYNGDCMCWDTEDGDDYEYDFDTDIVQYWMPLPGNPE